MMPSPRVLRIIARLLLPASQREFILGDLEELYSRRLEERGVVFASLHYVREMLASVVARRIPRGSRKRGNRGARWRVGGLLDDVVADARLTFGSLRRQPVFTITVALTLGAGVGSTGAVFGIVNQMWLRPVPGVESPKGLAVLTFSTPERDQMGLSGPVVETLQQSADLLDGFASFDFVSILANARGGRPIETRGYTVYGDYFELLGVRPVLGRMLTAEETGPGSDPYVAVISESHTSSRGRSVFICSERARSTADSPNSTPASQSP